MVKHSRGVGRRMRAEDVVCQGKAGVACGGDTGNSCVPQLPGPPAPQACA